MISNPLFAYLAVFAAGLVAAFSPCVLVTIPLIIGYVGGYADNDLKKSFLYTGLFSCGLALTFTILGAAAALTGSLLGEIGGFWKYILAAVAILMGLQLLGLINIQIPTASLARIGQKGWLGALLMGMLFGVATSPCATPVLAVVLTYVAAKQNLLYGISLLFTYSLANAAAVFLLGLSTGLATNVLRSKKLQLFSGYTHKISGAIFILAGLWFLLFFRK